jgi:hypothetical protein
MSEEGIALMLKGKSPLLLALRGAKKPHKTTGQGAGRGPLVIASLDITHLGFYGHGEGHIGSIGVL